MFLYVLFVQLRRAEKSELKQRQECLRDRIAKLSSFFDGSDLLQFVLKTSILISGKVIEHTRSEQARNERLTKSICSYHNTGAV